MCPTDIFNDYKATFEGLLQRNTEQTAHLQILNKLMTEVYKICCSYIKLSLFYTDSILLPLEEVSFGTDLIDLIDFYLFIQDNTFSD